VRALRERGVEATGGDISEFAVAAAPEELREHLEVRDLAQPLERRYDLITCVEVLEHMSPVDAQAAVAHLCAATDTVVLSSTPEDFREPTHINVRPAAAWAQDFATHGFFRRSDVDASFLSPWAVVFTRQQPTVVETVTRYESLLAPLLREVMDKRQALLEVQRELDRAREGATDDERAALLADVARLTDERDQAVAAQARLITARDRLQDELSELRGSGSTDDQLIRLALVDELMGVKAELAQARLQADNAVMDALEETDRLAEQLDDVRKSVTWRVGRTALLPVRAVQRLRRR